MTVEFGPVHSMPSEELEAGSLLDTKLRVWAEIEPGVVDSLLATISAREGFGAL